MTLAKIIKTIKQKASLINELSFVEEAIFFRKTN